MNPYHYTDAELIALLAQGDARAFQIIYEQCAPDLYKFLRKKISVKEDCEEIIHDVFASLWQRREELGNIESLRAYLFQSVRYKSFRYFYNLKVRKKYEEHFRLFEVVYDNVPSDQQQDAVAIRQLIDKSLGELPQRCQEAMKLRLDENLSNDDIARRMNIKKESVENYMVAAVAHLRTMFRKSRPVSSRQA